MANLKGQGRKPTPTNLGVLHGNPRSRPLSKSEPTPEVRLPDPPPQLLDVAVSLPEHGVAN